MALDTAFYLVTKEIAIRSGLIDVRYRTLDGRFILDNKDLSRVRFTTDEYISGLKGVEKITEAEAQTLIAQGGYTKGLVVDNSSFGNNGKEEEKETPIENVESDTESGKILDEQTVNSGDVGNVEDILGGGTQQDEENNENSEETKQEKEEE